MSPLLIFIGLASYFLVLLAIGYFTGRNATEDGYFLGNKQSIWWLVAIGMLSDSMSGVSFISVPGNVLKNNFYYLQVVIGYVIGYLVIAYVLLPLYYKQNLTSIYSYLNNRFGGIHQKTGALFFVLSRLTGSAGRLFLTAVILQKFLFSQWNIPFVVTVAIIIILILTYTIKGGIKTLVFTDALQSLFLVGGLLVCIIIMVVQTPSVVHQGAVSVVLESDYSAIFNFDFWSKSFFLKHIIGGAFLCIAMTGLDQNMMQKNLSCKSLNEAQKNMLTTAAVVLFVNLLFLSLGIFMIEFLKNADPKLLDPNHYADHKVLTDMFFPHIALNLLGPVAGMAFVLGLSAATFSSADSVLTTLTTSVYIDVLGLESRADLSVEQKHKRRVILHIAFSVLLLLTILVFYQFAKTTVINLILDIATYTYGPLLGLFTLGIFTKSQPKGWGILFISLLVPSVCYYLVNYQMNAMKYQIGYELLLINGALSFLGYWILGMFQSKSTIENQSIAN
jgi:SSS family solute:Na+ symporter